MATAAKQSIFFLLHEKGRGAICQHRVFVPISFLQNYVLFERRDGASEKSGATQKSLHPFCRFCENAIWKVLHILVLLNQVKIGDPMQVFGCIFVTLICA